MTCRPYILACVLACGLTPAIARADCAALTMPSPTDADLEQCLDSRPLLIGGAVLSLTVGGEDGFRASLLGQVDVLKIPRVYLSGRARYGGKYSELDLLGGIALSSGYGIGPVTRVFHSNTYYAHDKYYTRTTTRQTRIAVKRSHMLLLGGVRSNYMDPQNVGEPMMKQFTGFHTYVFGLGQHSATHDGGQIRIELLGFANAGTYGFSIKYFNEIVGMEFGWVPVDNGVDGLGMARKPYNMFFWNFIDFGKFADLL